MGAIATPHASATEAGAAAFAAGGNALDAALAAAVALTVAYPHQCAVGGDLFAVARGPDGRAVSVNASGAAPMLANADEQRTRGELMPVAGPDTVTVPGVAGGWAELHALGAALPWSAAFERAIELAEDGVRVARSLAGALAGHAPPAHVAPAGAATPELSLLADPGLAAVFAPSGEPLGERAPLRQPALAATLGELARDGARALYDGDLGARLARGLEVAGCRLRRADLEAYRPVREEPLRGRFRDLDVLTSPPNSSGVLLLQALAALDAAGGADPLGADAGMLARMLLLGDAQRAASLGDPRASAQDIGEWLGPERIAELVAQARAGTPAAAVPAGGRGDTIAVVAADDDWAVSLIQSLCGSFGAGILEPATGILMHSRGTSFSLVPGHPGELGPGRRPSHTLIPVLVERDGRLAGVLGAMGGRAHAQIHVQLLLRLLAGAGAQAAVDAPRWIAGGIEIARPGTGVRVEEGVPAAARRSLADAGAGEQTPLPRHSEAAGHAQAIWLRPDGRPDAGSDPRGDGAAIAAGP
jgi:gamma-glutamyltranspeptidase/glutathione hydrolase